MGYLSAAETDELKLPSNPEFWVRMKRRASYGDNRAAQSAMLQVSAAPQQPQQPNGQQLNGNAPQMVTDVEIGEYLGTLTVRLIVEWNITDVEGKLLPITLPNLDRLDPEDGDFLSAEAQKRVGGRAPEQQAPFGKPSGPPATATPPRTKKSPS